MQRFPVACHQIVKNYLKLQFRKGDYTSAYVCMAYSLNMNKRMTWRERKQWVICSMETRE